MCPYMHLLLSTLIAVTSNGETVSSDSDTTVIQSLSVDDCVCKALAINPILSSRKQDVLAAQSKKDAAYAMQLPSVSVLSLVGPVSSAQGNAITTSTPVNDFDHIFDDLGPFLRAELKIVQPLWTFGKLHHAIQALEELHAAKKSSVAFEQRKLKAQIEQLYWLHTYLETLQDLLDEALKIKDKAAQKLDEKLEEESAGVRPTDKLRLQAFSAELKSRHYELVMKLHVVHDGMSRLIGIDGSKWKTIDMAYKPLKIKKFDHIALLKKSSENHPLKKQIDHGINAAQANVKRLHAQYFPDFFLAGQIRYGIAPNRDDQISPFANDDFNFFDAGLAIGLRYHWSFVNRYEKQQAQATFASLVEKRKAVLEKINHDFFENYEQLKQWKATIKERKKAVRATRAWSVAATNGFELGTTSGKDVIDAVTAYFDARFKHATAIYKYNHWVSALTILSGETLRETN